METLQQLWDRFSGTQIKSLLNPPCPVNEIKNAETQLGFCLPEDLATILTLNNGQDLSKVGIFKNISGWNNYNKLKFLDIHGIVAARESFLKDDDLVAFFGDKLVPFSTEAGNDTLGDTYVINKETNQVFTLWTTAPDWSLPKDWQLGAFKRGESLMEFLKLQIMLYN